jgi:hypothetical protein
MLKVNLAEKLKVGQKQKESLLGEDFDPKNLLLEAHNKEQKIFNSLGFKSNSITTVHKNDVKRTAMAESIYGTISFLGKDLKKLCVEYDLKLLPTSYYNGDVPIEVARLVDDFCEKHSVMANDQNFFILAPSEMFNNEKHIPRNLDPILFYREKKDNGYRSSNFAVESDLFTQIHNWGNDFSFARKYRFLLSTYKDSRDDISNRRLFIISMIIFLTLFITSILLATPFMAVCGVIISYVTCLITNKNIFLDTWNNNKI